MQYAPAQVYMYGGLQPSTMQYAQPGMTYPLGPAPTDSELVARNLPPLRGYYEAQVPLNMTPRQIGYALRKHNIPIKKF